MEAVVLDSSLLAGYFLEGDPHHQKGQEYVKSLENGDYSFQLPMLVPVEVISAISRQAKRNRLALAARAKKILEDWERDGNIILYELNKQRMDNAQSVAMQYRLRGADSVLAALAQELNISLRTADGELLKRFPGATL